MNDRSQSVAENRQGKSLSIGSEPIHQNRRIGRRSELGLVRFED
jgi:hypothetical protein